MLIMILAWLVFGFIVGAVARAIYPGPQPMGFLGTSLLGIVGSVVGGVVANLVVGAPVLAFHTVGLIGSIVGALLVLAISAFGARAAHA